MKKLHFIWVFVALCLIVALLSVNTLAAEPVNTIRIGSVINKDHPLSAAIYRLSEQVENKTQGRIKIIYHPASELGSAVEQISGTRMGTQEVWFGANGQMARLMSEFQLCNPAFAYRNRATKKAFLDSLYFSRIREELRKKFGIVMLSWDWFRGYRSLLTIKPVRQIEDLKGIKLRVPRSSAKLFSWKTIGASPTPTAAAEIYMALKEKVVEGVEMDLFSMHLQHFDEVCKNYTPTQHDAIFSSLVINEKTWNSIAEKDRKIVLAAIADQGKWADGAMDKYRSEIIDLMQRQEKVAFIALSPEEREKFLKVGEQIMDELENTKKWWPKGTAAKIRAKDSIYYKN